MRLVVVLAVLALARGARADDVEPPPRDCPAGTTARSSHAGPHCEALLCEAGCPPGLSCVEQRFCVDTVPCGGHRGMMDDDCHVDFVLGECDAAGACARGTCTPQRVCLPSAPSSAPAPTTAVPAAPSTTTAEPAGGCAAVPGRGPLGALAALVVLLVASRGARRARS